MVHCNLYCEVIIYILLPVGVDKHKHCVALIHQRRPCLVALYQRRMPFAQPAENRGGIGDAIGPDVSLDFLGLTRTSTILCFVSRESRSHSILLV